ILRLEPKTAYERIVRLGGEHAAVLGASFELLARDAARDRTAKITGPSEGWLKADARWVDLALEVAGGQRGASEDQELTRGAIELSGASGDRRALRPLVERLGELDVDALCRAIERLGDASIVSELSSALPRLSRRDRAPVEALIRVLDPDGLSGALAP